MNTINNSADNGNRQIQPRDFSFLSEADQMLQTAVVNVLFRCWGKDNSDAICVSGMEISAYLNINNTVEHMSIAPGIVAYKGVLFEFEGYVFYDNGQMIQEYNNHIHYLDFQHQGLSYNKIAEPSPVYRSVGGNNIQDVECHQKNIVVMKSKPTPTSIPGGVGIKTLDGLYIRPSGHNADYNYENYINNELQSLLGNITSY